MPENNDKEAIGRTFADVDDARAHALVLRDQGMSACVIGPVKHAFIVGPMNQALPWPNPPTVDQWLVIGTDASIERPPAQQDAG